METTPKITIEELAVKLNGKMWFKDDLKRIYLDRGYNTKKMSTKTYVFEKDGQFIVVCKVECDNQPMQWCDSQEAQIIEGVEKEIEAALVTEYYLVINNDTAMFVDDCGTEKPMNDLYGSDIYFSKRAAERFIENELNGNYSVQQISRVAFDRQVAELDAKEKNETIPLYNIDELIENAAMQSGNSKKEVSDIISKMVLAFDSDMFNALHKLNGFALYIMFNYNNHHAIDVVINDRNQEIGFLHNSGGFLTFTGDDWMGNDTYKKIGQISQRYFQSIE